MNYSFKLKVKQQPSVPKEEPSVRRIRTDHVDVIKRLTKQPLGENKKILNHQPNQSINLGGKPVKKLTAIKSVLSKNGNGMSRVTTEHSERPTYLGHQRTATAGERIGGPHPKKHAQIDLNSTNTAGFKKK
jgi:hypothetical protein